MGKAGTPEDGRKHNGHWKKAGAGRPRLKPEERKQRRSHQIRAFDDEYEIIKRFILLVRKDKAKCEQAVSILEIDEQGSEAHD